jgi:hypothetical protein
MSNKSIVELNTEKLAHLNLSTKERTLLNSLIVFYSTPEYIKEILPIINGYSNISLRVLDWFATNYSKKQNISYVITIDHESVLFNVNKSYKAQLKAYSKKLFDPFCRGNKIPYLFDDENVIITTIGQLNFFKWAVSNDILEYVLKHLNEIDDDMNKNKNLNGKKKKKILKCSEVIFEDDTISTTISDSSENSDRMKLSREIIVTFG